MTGIGSLRSGLLRSATFAVALSVMVASPTVVQAEDASVRFQMAANPLQVSLITFAERTGLQLIYSPETVRGRQAPALSGTFTVDVALRRLLVGTGIRIRRVGAKVIVLDRPGDSPSPGRTGAVSDGPASPVASQVGDGTGQTIGAMAQGESAPANEDIVVTGTLIRGQQAVTSPVTTIRRADFERNGYATVAQALQALPGNFGGTATEQSALSFADASSSNSSLSTGVNLRGLGADATLVLVNGRRIAGSGTMGDFADVSSIPTGAVDRVEVLLDGASALYGSDAVGGVVNIILKDRYDGAESRARFGSVTRGGATNVQIDQTIGTRWRTGGAMLSYEFDRRTALASADRRFARSADSRPLGGTDHRYYLSLPGNILGIDAATGSFGPSYAIPTGQDGTRLTANDFIAGSVNLEDFRYGTDLTPNQTRHSLYATVDQDLGSDIRVMVEGRYSRRRFETRSLGASSIFVVTPDNPYFVSPTGSDFDLIAYSFAHELGGTRVRGEAEAMALTGSVDADLGAGWKLAGYAAFAQNRDRDVTETINNANLSEALGATPDDPATSFSAARDGYFNPYGTGSSNSAAILAFVGSGYYEDNNRSRILTGNIQADGPLFATGGGSARLAIGGNIRREGFATRNVNFTDTATPVASVPVSYSRSIGAAFAELYLPLVGAANSRAWLYRLEVSAAGRIEHYGDFGTTANPKVGFRWTPFDGIALRASYGTSFRAPNLRELNARSRLGTSLLTRADGVSVVAIQLSGGNPDLKAERAKSWTAGADIAPSGISGLQIGGGFFHTIFDRRVDQPVADFANALTNPDYAPFVRYVSPTTSSSDLAYVTALLADRSLSSGSAYPPGAVGAVVDTRYVNTGEVDVSGVDFSLRYTLQRGVDRFDLGASGSYLLRYRQRLTPTAAAIDQRNLAGKPVDLRGRLTLGWTHGAFDALGGMNFVDRYRDLAGNRIRAWTTFDLQLAYRPEKGRGILQGASIALIAQNLFDRDPPFYDSPVGSGYDAANADAIGRFVSLQISKRW